MVVEHQFHVDARMLRHELGRPRHNPPTTQRNRRKYPQTARQLPRAFAHGAVGPIDRREDLPCVLQVLLAFVCKRHTARRAVQQLGSQPCLQLLQGRVTCGCETLRSRAAAAKPPRSAVRTKAVRASSRSILIPLLYAQCTPSADHSGLPQAARRCAMQLGYTVLFVPAVTAAVEFYERAFGLERGLATPDFAATRSTGATMLAFGAESNERRELGSATSFRPNRPDVEPAGIQISFIADDVVQAFERAVGADAQPVVSPQGGVMLLLNRAFGVGNVLLGWISLGGFLGFSISFVVGVLVASAIAARVIERRSSSPA